MSRNWFRMNKTEQKKGTNSTKTIVEALMGAIVDGVITIDSTGIIQAVNPATERIFGYQASEIIGHNIKILMPDSYAREHDGYLHNYLTTGIKKIIGHGREVVGKRKDGSTFPLELAISDMEVDGKQMFAGIVRDISERKRVESALLRSNKRLALATEAGGVGVWEYDISSGSLVWDDRMFQIYGISREEFSGAYEAWHHALHPDDLKRAEHSLQQAIELGESFDEEFRIRWPNGEQRYIQAHAQTLKDSSGVVTSMIGVNIDTTPTKLAILESKAREKRIRALIDTIVDGIIVINNKGGILSVNPAAEKLFGYTQDELEQKNIKMLMPEPYRSAHDGYLKNYFNTGHKKIIGIGREVIGQRKDGSTFPMELSVSEAEVAGEQLFTGIVRNISERKMVMDQLRMQSGALEAAANAILITDSNGIIQWVNSAFTHLSGFHSEEVIGKTPMLLKSGKHSPQFFKELWQTVKEGRVWHGEVINKRKDGSFYTEEQTITPLTDEDGKLTHFIAIKLDISERKSAEAALAQKNLELEVAAEFERTQSKVITLFNSYSEPSEIFRLTLELLADSHDFHLSAVYLFDEWSGSLNCTASHGLSKGLSRHIDVGSGIVGQAAKSGRQVLIEASDEMPFKIDTGLFSINPAVVLVNPITYSNKILAVLVLSSMRRLKSNELQFIDRLSKQIGISLNNLNQYQHLKALSEQLKQRGKEISGKNAQLEQSNRLKTEFLANMSHELRTPLNAIIGFSEVLKDKILGDLNAEQFDYSQEIFESANHLLSLINDILDLSKIEAGKMTLQREVVNLPELLRNSMSIVKETAHTHNIQLKLVIADNIDFLKVDSRKFKQVIFNLLSNAVKFTPDGGNVRIEALRDESNLLIRISDTGIGIAEDQIELLFQPFVQLDGSLSRHYEGTGLGLAMVKRLVELHQGEVSVTSSKGKGSCFQISFPYSEESINGNKEILSEKDSTGNTDKRQLTPCQQLRVTQELDSEANYHVTTEPQNELIKILVVEESSKSGNLFKVQLEQAGYQVLMASSQSVALQIAREELPQLIVLDVMLLDVVSLDLIHQLSLDPVLKDIQVISIASNESKQILLGTMNVLEKPIYRSILLETVNRYLPDHSHNAKVLVVDDDVKAVQFLTDQLQAAGLKTLAAYDGKNAIEVAIEHQPELIILDLIMPDINGFEVMSRLRNIQECCLIPIIVLTAKNLDGHERELLRSSVVQIIDKSGFETENFLNLVQERLKSVPDLPYQPLIEQSLVNASSSDPLILVVEDNLQQATLLKLYLTDAGYRVLLASDGEEALVLMKREPPDLITLDVLMPKMDGLAFLDAKNMLPEFSNIPVMLLSAVSGQLESSAVTADAVLSKPIQRSQILNLISSLLPCKASTDRSQVKILLIDDDPKAIKIVASYLAGSNYDVTSALSGADGFELACSESPDVIILDLMMPEMSGFEVVSLLKQNPDTSDIPVVILTAKLLSQEDRDKLSGQVAVISEKSNTDRESLMAEIEKTFNRYQTK